MIDYNKIDYESLRMKIIGYYGPAMPIDPLAQSEVVAAESAGPMELINMAKSIPGINLEDFIEEDYTNRL